MLVEGLGDEGTEEVQQYEHFRTCRRVSSRGKLILVSLLSLALLFATLPQNLSAHQDAPTPPTRRRKRKRRPTRNKLPSSCSSW